MRLELPVNVISVFVGAKIKQNINTQSQKEFGKLKKLNEGNVEQ